MKGKNVEVTPALRGYAEKRVSKLERFFLRGSPEATVTLSLERGSHRVDVTMQVGGLILRGESRTNDMYASIDDAVDKIVQQIKKYKTRINKRLKQAGEQLVVAEPEVGASVPEAEGEPRIVRTKRFAIKPMSPEEAVMQIELIGHDFFVFFNAETEEVNVVYKRKDGNYGLIEPES